jgi:hypothetical protein
VLRGRFPRNFVVAARILEKKYLLWECLDSPHETNRVGEALRPWRPSSGERGEGRRGKMSRPGSHPLIADRVQQELGEEERYRREEGEGRSDAEKTERDVQSQFLHT